MTQQTMERATENAALVAAGYEAFGRGDLAAVERLFDPEAVWHAQRLGQLSGDHRGWPAVMKFFADTMILSEGTFRIEILDILANDTGAAVVLKSIARRGERTLDDLQVHVFQLRADRVTDVRQFVGDGPAVEAFWS